MKLKSGFVISNVDGKYVAVAVGEAGKSFSGMIKMNATAAFIAERLKEEITLDDLAQAVCEKYDIDEQRARASVEKAVMSLRECGLIEE